MEDMVSQSLKDRFPPSHWILLDDLSKILNDLSQKSEPMFSYSPTHDLVQFYNGYIDFALSIYVDKFKQMYRALAESLEREWYIVYAQSGRSIIENTATLRYYARHKDFNEAKENCQHDRMDKKTIMHAIETLDRFVRGNRFSWEAFIEGRFDELSKTPHQENLAQVNIRTCLDHWFKDSPTIENLYDLLCDLVHPNFGSNMLVMRSLRGELVAGGTDGKTVSLFIVCPTLAGIVGAYKEIQENLLRFDLLKLAYDHDG